MSLRVAMPAIKGTSDGEYSGFYDKIAMTLRHHPRIEAGNSEDSEGLDIKIEALEENSDDLENARKLYATFPGALKFEGPNKLILSFVKEPSNLTICGNTSNLTICDTHSWLYHLNKSCLQLNRITYECVDKSTIVGALSELYSDENWSNYEKILRKFEEDGFLFKRGEKIIKPVEKEDIKEAIQDFTSTGNTLCIDAGTFIGKMVGETEENKTYYHILIKFLDKKENALNPIYFFRLLLKWRNYPPNDDKEKWIQFIDQYFDEDTLCKPNQADTKIHPLIKLLRYNKRDNEAGVDYLSKLDKEIDRNTETYWRLFVPPASALKKVSENENQHVADLVKYEREDGIPDKVSFEWRVDDYGFLVYRKKQEEERQNPCEEEAYFTFDSGTFDKVKNMWGKWEAIKNSINAFKTPAELILPTILRESRANKRAVGIEYLPRGKKGKRCLKKKEKCPKKCYDSTSDCGCKCFNYCKLTNPKKSASSNDLECKRLESRVPEGEYKDLKISKKRNPSYTWGQLKNDLDNAVPKECRKEFYGTENEVFGTHIKDRVSPGLMQTLVSTAMEKISKEENKESIKKTINPANPDSVKLPQGAASTFDWLILKGENSIAAGVAKLAEDAKRGFTKNVSIKIRFDPIKVRVMYRGGSGGLEYAENFENVRKGKPSWVLGYNAAVAYLNKNCGEIGFKDITRLATINPDDGSNSQEE